MVVDDANEPSAATVVLVPAGEKQNDRALFRRSGVSGKGLFTLRGIVPGTYKVLAFDDVDFEDLIARPEILKPYEDRAGAVIVDERGKYNLVLKVIRSVEEP
jgi:hypothetical protein